LDPVYQRRAEGRGNFGTYAPIPGQRESWQYTARFWRANAASAGVPTPSVTTPAGAAPSTTAPTATAPSTTAPTATAPATPAPSTTAPSGSTPTPRG
jgi:hypothetical protein